MIPLRSGAASTALHQNNGVGPHQQQVASQLNNHHLIMNNGALIDPTQTGMMSQLMSNGQVNNQAKKSGSSKQRGVNNNTAQGHSSNQNGFSNINSNNNNGYGGSLTSATHHRGSENGGNASIIINHNQTAKIPQHYLNGGNFQKMPNMTAALSAAGVQVPSSLSMNTGIIQMSGSQLDKNLSASQKKRISLKKLEEEYCKTIEQVGSPNSSTLNLENMKKTQSLHYMRAGSGASSPQQIKSRTSIGKYGANGQNPAAIGMQLYNNYNNQIIATANTSAVSNQNQRNSYVSKSQIGGGNGGPLINQGIPQPPGSAMGTGNRSRSKTTNRKKRNLYTSVGNYYQSQQPSANQAGPQTNNSASRVTKRVHQQNFLDNLEQTNMLIGGNLAAAHQFLLQEELTKKRNKSSTKSYNNKELIDHNNSSEICYSSHLTKKNPMTNNFFDVSQFSSNHNSIAKNFENSFQFSAGGFLTSNKHQHHNTSGVASLSAAVSANKQRPTSSHKSALMQAAQAASNNNSSSVKGTGKKKTQTLRKSVNNVLPTAYNSNNLMNSSANYGQLQQNAYDFLSNASLFLNSNKNARRPKGGNSAIDSRCSQNKDHVNALGMVKSQVASNTAFGHLNNTSHTTIVSNRKAGNHGEIVSGKKNSLQQQLLQQNYISLAGGQHTSDMLTAGEISSDRQTLKMNDFLKQIEAYSNDQLDKFMPSMNQVQQSVSTSLPGGSSVLNGSVIGNYNFSHQLKVAEQVKTLIDKEMSSMAIAIKTNSSKQRYPNDESRGNEEDGGNHDDDEDAEGAAQPDYEHLLNVISDSFNSLISTFYQNKATAIVGVSLGRIKESYEEIINSIVENLSQQIESLQQDVDVLSDENVILKERNAILEQQTSNQEQVTSFAIKNEALVEELNKMKEENKNLKKEQKDRDSQLKESLKMIEKLSASQKQLITQNNHNVSGSSKMGIKNPNDSMQMNSSKNVNKSSTASVPPLDLGKLKMVQQQQILHQQPQIQSNDSIQTMDKAFLNANLHDPSQSSVMNTVPHHDGSRILDELYSNQNQAPFVVNQSGISYVNSEENDPDEENGAYLNSGGTNHAGLAILNQSGRQSSIAQDKSPIMKPHIPPLNLSGLNNRTQAARQGIAQQQQQQQQPISQIQNKQPKFKLDLSNVPPPQQYVNPPADQDSHTQARDYRPAAPLQAPLVNKGLGLNLANLKQQAGIVDFQDEFMAKYDEYSESWRNAMAREKRF